MNNMNIGIDLDDVIVDLIGELVNIYNRKYKINISRQDVCDWGSFPPEVYEEFRFSKGYRKLKLIPGAKEFLFWLRSIAKTSIITIRSDEDREDTYESLEKNIPGLYEPENVYLTNGSKVDTCRRLGLHLLIDDSVNQTREVSKNLGIYSILYNNGTQMFRNAENHLRIYKAENIDEAKRYVLRIKSILSET